MTNPTPPSPEPLDTVAMREKLAWIIGQPAQFPDRVVPVEFLQRCLDALDQRGEEIAKLKAQLDEIRNREADGIFHDFA